MDKLNLKAILKTLKLHESTISMLLGALVIVVAGIIIINYISSKKGETVPPIEIEEVQEGPKTHVVQEGEDLWKISEKYYGTGFKWSKIAEANNISDPNQIKAGQTLTIPPLLDSEIAQAQPTGITLTPTVTETEEKIKETVTSSPTPVLPEEKEEKPLTSVNEHTVSKGESLWKIAEKYYKSGYNWIDIAKANNLKNPNYIEVGQKLTIPSIEAKLATIDKTQSRPKLEPITGDTYKVVKGDSLWKIAERAYGSGFKWIDIARENKLANPRIIHPGNELKLPR